MSSTLTQLLIFIALSCGTAQIIVAHTAQSVVLHTLMAGRTGEMDNIAYDLATHLS